jgi:hypothetical protein
MAVSHEWFHGFTIAQVGVFRAEANFLNSARGNGDTASPQKIQPATCQRPIERQNLAMRMSIRRFTRLTNAFSKKLENLQAAGALHFAHYNLVRLHKTLRMTPMPLLFRGVRSWTFFIS